MGIGYAEMEAIIEPKHFQPFAIVHGGLIASLIDSTTFWSVYMGILDENDGLTSVDLKLNYLSSCSELGKKLIAKGKQIKLGKSRARWASGREVKWDPCQK